ncbi:T9SS-dependent choice-of-anchor J family protein [Solirubrum puertoriconensis]|uniref:T9SS-dependent choice-of-anchor J family protein n=1 Tax=Solirubrum puertoriconensis TaxID=1751427 RepID=UPI00098F3640|nr:choice-of-anchor J domain-containing protein [Solirubrum puertoriconensis]
MKSPLLLGLLGLGVLSFAPQHAWAQATLGSSPYKQNFDALASGLPAGFTVRSAASATALGTSQTLVTTPTEWSLGTPVGFKNYASATGLTASTSATDQAAATNRALGVRQTSTSGYDPGAAFVFQAANTTGRYELQLNFKLQSLDVASPRTTNWRVDYAVGANPTSFTALPTSAVTGNSTFGSTSVDVDFGNALDDKNEPVWIRIVALSASTGSGNRPTSAIDDFDLSWKTASDARLISSVTDLGFGTQNVGSTGNQTFTLGGANLTENTTLTATGPYQLSKDNTTFASSISYAPAELATNQTVYVRFAPTASGLATGSIAIASQGAASKTVALRGTGFDPANPTYSFNDCGNNLADGWTQVSVTGAQVWGCTTFGRDANDASGKGTSPNAVQINGFSGTAQTNEDWLISPSLNISSMNVPLLSFWSRTRFNGPAVQLRVSTNYSGTGSPTAAGVTWTTIDVDLPAANTDTWTQTSNVDLSAYKGSPVYVAFVYTSSAASGAAQWTIDDIQVTNSSTPAPVAVRAVPNRLNFDYVKENEKATRKFVTTSRNVTGDVTITSPSTAFKVSKDGTTFSNSVTFTAAEALASPKEVTVEFAPTAANTNYTASLSITSPGATAVPVALAGNTYVPNATLDVVNWNIEWFGATGNGPTDEALQETNAKKVLTDLNADVYGLAEIVDTAKLGAMVRQLPGGYRYSVSTGVSGSAFSSAQKLVFVYRSTSFSNATFTTLSTCTSCTDPNNWSTNWSTGRVPYLMEADVKLTNGQTRRVAFVLIHAKANESNDGGDSYNRRKAGAEALKAELDARYGTSNVLIMGDFNDDLDVTIANIPNVTASSYQAFTADAAQYSALTLPLSQAGLKSTVGFNDVIDHVVVSNEMNTFYLEGSANIRTDVAGTITNYGSTTSDHYPIQTRFNLGANVVTSGKASLATVKLGLYPNPVSKSVRVEVPERGQNLQLQVLTSDGRVAISAKGSLEQLNQQLNQKVGNLNAGMYTVRIVGEQQTYVERFVKQ